MDLLEALYTTRAMRRVRPDPIPVDVQARIMDAAVRAPSGGNQQNWRFLLVDDPASRRPPWPPLPARHAAVDDALRPSWPRRPRNPDDPESVQMLKVQRSAQWLADHFEEVPLYLFPFCQHDPTGGSIYPAVWSAMLAARAEGVGSCLTVLLGLFHRAETLDVLGSQPDQGWVMAGCVSFGYPTGRWDVAPRRPVHEVTNRNGWNGDPGFDPRAPLWSPT